MNLMVHSKPPKNYPEQITDLQGLLYLNLTLVEHRKKTTL